MHLSQTAVVAVTIRLARETDLVAVQQVEVAAGALFASVGMDAIADDGPPPLEWFSGYQQAGRGWVAVDERDRVVGYLLVDVVDGAAHIEQVTVHPDHARQGLGRLLVDTAGRWAAALGLSAVTLTTFKDVPWNAPYYERLGFTELAEEQVTEGLREVRAREAAHGLDAWPRIVMHRAAPSS